jgi:fructoselysine-6-P-deglycase FrlB-like protein
VGFVTDGWHTDDFPELRPGPPWVMEEMIAAQAALPDGLVGLEAASTVHAAVDRALRAGEEVVVVGCGTSEHGAMAVAGLLREAFSAVPASRRIHARQALDAALDPSPRGLVLGVSHDGGTRATLLALVEARRAGAATAAITARADSEISHAADIVLVTPALDRSWCHTLAYMSAILAGAAIAHTGGDDAWAGVAAAVIAACLADERPLAAGAELFPAGRVVTAGLGSDHVAARELALKIEEGARIPATAHHLETLLHGHLVGCDAATTRVVLLAVDPDPEPRRRRRLELALRATAATGIPVTLIARAGGAPDVPVPADVVELARAQTPAGPHALLGAFLAAAVSLQCLTLGLVLAAGTNPDLIRREQAPYRAAADVAEAVGEW